MNLRKHLITLSYNTASQVVGKFISVLLGILIISILTRYLGINDYGNYVLIFAYLSFFTIISDFGLQVTVVNELNNLKNEKEYTIGTFIWLKVVLNLISILVSIIVLFFFPYSFELKTGILIGILAVAISNLISIANGIFQAKLRMDLIAGIDLLTKVINTLLIILFISFKLNFYYIVASVLISNFLGFIVSLSILRNFVKLKPLFSKTVAKKLLLFSLPIGISLFFSSIYFKLDTLMLSVMKNSEQVGIYNIAYKVLENVLLLWGFYMATAYPMFARFSSKKYKSEYRSIMKISLLVLCISSIVIIIIGYFLAPFIVYVLSGKIYSGSILSLRILLLSIPFFFLNNLIYFLNIIKKRLNVILLGLMLSVIFNFFINLLFIPKLGYVGTSYTTLITEFFLLLFYIVVYVKYK